MLRRGGSKTRVKEPPMVCIQTRDDRPSETDTGKLPSRASAATHCGAEFIGFIGSPSGFLLICRRPPFTAHLKPTEHSPRLRLRSWSYSLAKAWVIVRPCAAIMIKDLGAGRRWRRRRWV